MFITSKNAITEAITKDLVKILYIKSPLSKREKEIIKIAERKKIKIKTVDKKEMESIIGKVYSIAADIEENAEIGIDYFLDNALNKKNNPLIFILDSITDVHNLGAIIRNAYFFNLDGIIIPKDNSAKINEKVYEVSQGAAYHLPICIETNLNRILPTAIILGNEHKGVRETIKKNSDGSIVINSLSDFDSLNVSATSAIIGYAYSIFKN